MAAGWSAAIGAIGSLAGSLLSNNASSQMLGLSKEAQQELMKYQAQLNWKYYNKDLNTNKYALSRQQLEEAGYNPYLMPGSQLSANAHWTSPQSVTDLGAGANAVGAVANANQAHQIEQQGSLIDAQVQQANADSVLKNMQSQSEVVRRLNIEADTNIKSIQAKLANEDLNNYERNQLRQDLDVWIRYKTMTNDYKIRMYQNSLQESVINSNINVNNATMREINTRNEINKLELDKRRNYYNKNGGLPQYIYNLGQAGRDLSPFQKAIK